MHIAIAGNIGAGKTTLASKLAEHYNWIPCFESVEDNPYLEDFYGDMKKWAFHLQIYFLNHRFNQVVQVQQNPLPTIQDRTIYEDAHIFAKGLHTSGIMTPRDFENYWQVYNTMLSFVASPDVLIYLKGDLPKLMEQIKRRGREYEQGLEEYVADLNIHYNNWIDDYKESPLIVYDINEADFLRSQSDWEHLLQQIDQVLANKKGVVSQ
jgi:deoxyadenosine/deoxycytidine kinase